MIEASVVRRIDVVDGNEVFAAADSVHMEWLQRPQWCPESQEGGNNIPDRCS